MGVGVIGVGYWGPNLLRNFNNASGAEARWAADLDTGRLEHIKKLYPSVRTTQDYREMLADEGTDAVVIATPADTHCRLAVEAFEAGKHVFVEKPMAISEDECRQMVQASEKAGRKLMVGHTFLFNNAVHQIKQLIDSGELGDIYYVYVNRVNLGLFREDCNVVWDLAPHDIAILNWLLDSTPVSLTAVGHSYVQPDIEDVAFVNLQYPNKVMAHLHVSWLDPNKVRTITVVGSKKMLVYDDVSNTEKLRVYDKGVNVVMPHYDTFGEFQLSYRYGDIVLPRIEDSEPLRNEAEHFVDAILNDSTPRSDGHSGLEVVRTLEAACDSMREGGAARILGGASVGG
ncbi:gfo/Idh/MocA family oxidoreductase [bacterium]|nr:MAG: gfo/Idh/MocA family oxidoreductase [bacterium]RKZ14285.1 MAG: gfo/Idh/MocA family oxidoreductase [bacterium]